jgi:glycosyltransferase involved in cell wall biosynthesis
MNLVHKVSVITTCYNDGVYLQECVESVANQTYPNIEHIIINDGSTDFKTIKILGNLTSIFSNNIRVINTDNQGVCAARNFAIENSGGKYILPLDSDDRISPMFVELAVYEANKNINVKLVVTNYKLFGRLQNTVIVEDFSLEKLIGRNLFVVSSLFRRDDFDRVSGFNTNMSKGLEDWDFWLSVLKGGGKVVKVKGINFFYRIKSIKQSRNANSAACNHNLLRKQMWQNHRELFSKHYASPLESIEYLNIFNSKDYKLGKTILTPIRMILSLFR